jgi:hydroxyacylglutathione hydrolase
MENIYSIEQLSPDIWSINEKNGRCFLLDGEKQSLLIDTGYGGGDLFEAVSRLTQKPVFVVNTHADPDHIGANNQFADIRMHPAEFDRYYSKLKPPAPPHAVWEGNTIDLGNFQLEVIFTPGHTPGAISLLERNRRFLIGGDNVQTANIYMFGPGRNIFAYIESLTKLCNMADSFDYIYSSHGNVKVGRDVLNGVLRGAKRLVDGELEGETAPQGLPCKLFKCDVCGFYY